LPANAETSALIISQYYLFISAFARATLRTIAVLPTKIVGSWTCEYSIIRVRKSNSPRNEVNRRVNQQFHEETRRQSPDHRRGRPPQRVRPAPDAHINTNSQINVVTTVMVLRRIRHAAQTTENANAISRRAKASTSLWVDKSTGSRR